MKKYFKYYAVLWMILFAVYNAVTFLIVPRELAVAGLTLDKFAGAFWPGYIAIVVAFLGNLLCTFRAFREENREKVFLRMPLYTFSRACLIVTLIVGTVTMLILDLPNWIGALICLAVLAIYAILLVKADAAAEAVSDVGAKAKAQTSAMKVMTADAESVLSLAKSEEAKAEVKKVYEAIRYSDPMSNDALSAVEGKIADRMLALKDAVKADNPDAVKAIAEEIIDLVKDRTVKCKMLK